jgi:threonine dehydrogenase-like Zn-dependent dehydrogenase
MRAAVMRGRTLAVEDVAAPIPGPGQVLVQTLACGICGSDLHMLQHAGTLAEATRASGAPFLVDFDQGIVMGHEFSGRVLALGPGAAGVTPGDVVVSMPVMLTPDGPVTVGYSNHYPGGYGERMVLLAAFCLKVPEGLDPRLAALTEPMAVGRHAVARSGIGPGEAAAVLGCGPIGLAVIAWLRLAGIQPIVAADFSPKRRELAARLGAGHVVDPRQEGAVEAWTRLDGQRPLVIFEAVGARGMIDAAMRAAPRLARLCVVGVCLETDEIWPIVGVNKELTVQFALGYTLEEFAGTLDTIASGELDVAPLITAEVGIAGVPDAFAALASPDEQVKILVRPELG